MNLPSTRMLSMELSYDYERVTQIHHEKEYVPSCCMGTAPSGSTHHPASSLQASIFGELLVGCRSVAKPRTLALMSGAADKSGHSSFAVGRATSIILVSLAAIEVFAPNLPSARRSPMVVLRHQGSCRRRALRLCGQVDAGSPKGRFPAETMLESV
jgi:hypothetical protein